MPATASETPTPASAEPVSERPAPSAGGPVKSARPRRGDIQGIRALCMIQVLLYHAWHVGSPIGVDAFIMISAYLMTGSFLRRAESGRMPLFVERWANTFKRLLPPLVFVVLVTLWGATRLLPERLGSEMVTQAFASLGYWENWRLVHNAADYYAVDQSAMSPFQHLWSMSMQGQVFLAWPVLMTVAVGIRRVLRKKVDLRVVTVVIFAGITAWSLWWLLTSGAADPSAAYFDTRSRVWEFALGSAIAAAEPLLRRIPRVAPYATWGGLGVLLVYCLVEIGSYPGPMATVPMLAVAMVLVYGDQSARTPQRLLSWGPLVWLGNISYCVYLVHWPMFIFFLAAVERSRMTVVDGIVMICLSIIVAFALTRLLDDPVRLWPWANKSAWRKALVCVVSLAVGFAGVLAMKQDVDRTVAAAAEQARTADREQHPGALIFDPGHDLPAGGFTEEPIPAPSDFDNQWSTLEKPCPGDVRGLFSENLNDFDCTDGLSGTPDSDEILVVGDSHSRQWLPAIEVFAEKHAMRVRSINLGACRLVTDLSTGVSPRCVNYNEGTWKYIQSEKPEYVFLIATSAVPDSPAETKTHNLDEVVKRLTSKGSKVIGMRDNIRSESNLFDCSVGAVEEGSPYGCLWHESDHLAAKSPSEDLKDVKGFYGIDMNDIVCPNGLCTGVIGNVYVYLDGHHFTRSFMKTMGTALNERLSAALGIDPEPAAKADPRGGDRAQSGDGEQSGDKAQSGRRSDAPAQSGAVPQDEPDHADDATPAELEPPSVLEDEPVWEPEYVPEWDYWE